MSGGSFDYLGDCPPDDILGRPRDLDRMATALEACPVEYGPRAAIAANEIRGVLEEAQGLVERLDVLRDVMRAVEWHVSADWGPETVREALEQLKGRKP